KHFEFEAETVKPAIGGIKQLTPGYTLKLSHDSLVSYLPYFGKAYSAPINPSDVGFDFTSSNLDYKASATKKGGYQVSIKSKDRIYNADFLLTVYDNGTAYLQVSSADRQP